LLKATNAALLKKENKCPGCGILLFQHLSFRGTLQSWLPKSLHHDLANIITTKPASLSGDMESHGSLGLKGDLGKVGALVPSPRSEAVTHDLQELSLQPTQSLPPIKERKNVLQLRLQQRRTREQLADQGIMPPLKTPAAFHEQVRSLERARTENFLKHKIRSRPERAELVRMHILQETHAEPSLQATQMKLKRARLADDLNEKIAQRPGPMELVEKNILPVEIVAELDMYSFTEDSSEALSPELPANHESPGSASSPAEARLPDSSPVSPPTGSRLQQSQPKQSSDKIRSKKSKDAKPRIKKLKYHQYIPPDQKQEPMEAPMDSAYARLLQQQQQFLQLQILSQQQQQYNYPAILPAPLKPVAESKNSCPNITLSSSPSRSTPIMAPLPNPTPSPPNTNRKLVSLPTNLDELKVVELKTELKLRGLPVSGTKIDLIERLKTHQESGFQSTTVMDVNISKPEYMISTPPVSPERSESSSLSIEDSPTTLSPARLPRGPSPLKPTLEMVVRVSEKDQRLHEKERQIEELMHKLEQEQRLVEQLKMQLEVEKRCQQSGGHQYDHHPPIQVKEENEATPSCNYAMGSMLGVKQEEPLVKMQQFYVNPQQLPQVQHHLLNSPPPSQIRMPVSLSNNSISQQAPSVLHPTMPSLSQSIMQTQMSSNGMQQQHSSPTPSPPQTLCRSSPSGFEFRQNQPMGEMSHQLNYILQPSSLPNHHSPKSKDPPRYEEAVKQSRGLQVPMQVPTATSQHMDDLFDVLIESGEMPPISRQDLPIDKLHPVTANITVLPINTVLSRPPPQIHMARAPNQTLVALASDGQLEALLEEAEPRTLRLMEELKHQLLDRPQSPMDTSELAFTGGTTCGLPDAGLDNMEWLDLTIPVPAGISSQNTLFSSDFLDSTDLPLHWE
ncbi:hypothetical protein DNTS_025388, partial [Danionella cerebrum]